MTTTAVHNSASPAAPQHTDDDNVGKAATAVAAELHEAIGDGSAEEKQPQSHSRHGCERISAAREQHSYSSPVAGCVASASPVSFSSHKVTAASNTFLKHSAGQNVNKAITNKYTKLSERHAKHDTSDKMVAMQEPTATEQFSFDDSEELQYGPGIVSKLRCRYLSLALRQSTCKQRPSLDNLRRATSLNNLLNEEDDIESSRKSWDKKSPAGDSDKSRTPDDLISSHFHHKKQSIEKTSSNGNSRCRLQQRGNDSMKRARSVEALMRYDQSAWQRDQSKDKTNGGANKSVSATTIIETIPEVPSHPKPPPHSHNHSAKQTAIVDTVTIEDKIINARERGEAKPKRLTSFMDETERPPPDLVKHTLRMFEATANRRPNGATRVANSHDVAAKVTTFQSIIASEKSPLIFIKPPLSPSKKPAVAPRTTTTTSRTNGIATASSNNNILASASISNGHSKSAATVKPNVAVAAKQISSIDTTNSRSPSPLTVRVDTAYRTNKLDSPLSPRIYAPFLSSPLSPIGNAYRTATAADDDRSPDLLKTVTKANNMDSPMVALSKKIEGLSIESPTTASPTFKPNHFSTDLTDDANSTPNGEEDDRIALRRISKTALANISKAGTTTEFKFGPKATKSYLPGGSFSGNITSTPKKLQNDAEPAPQQSPTTRQIGIIRPQVKAPAPPIEHIPNNTLSPKQTETSSLDAHHTKANAAAHPDSMTIAPSVLEKNQINREKSEESLPAASKWVTPTSSPAFQKPWQQIADPHNNSMVFNFSNRKEVPDYIENDGLVVRRKRELPKVSKPIINVPQFTQRGTSFYIHQSILNIPYAINLYCNYMAASIFASKDNRRSPYQSHRSEDIALFFVW